MTCLVMKISELKRKLKQVTAERDYLLSKGIQFYDVQDPGVQKKRIVIEYNPLLDLIEDEDLFLQQFFNTLKENRNGKKSY